MSELNIRTATRDDVALILAFIRELAEYEKLAHEVVATETQLTENLFGSQPQAEVVIAEWRNEPCGFALFFGTCPMVLREPRCCLKTIAGKARRAVHSRDYGQALQHSRRRFEAQPRGTGQISFRALSLVAHLEQPNHTPRSAPRTKSATVAATQYHGTGSNFSTFRGQHGLYLEDLYVRPEFRGKSVGKSLLKYLARLAIERNCARFEWSMESRWALNTIRVARPQACSARRVAQSIVGATLKPRNTADALVASNPSGRDQLSPTLRCSRLPGHHQATSLAPGFDDNWHTAATVFKAHRDSLIGMYRP